MSIVGHNGPDRCAGLDSRRNQTAAEAGRFRPGRTPGPFLAFSLGLRREATRQVGERPATAPTDFVGPGLTEAKPLGPVEDT